MMSSAASPSRLEANLREKAQNRPPTLQQKSLKGVMALTRLSRIRRGTSQDVEALGMHEREQRENLTMHQTQAAPAPVRMQHSIGGKLQVIGKRA
jgi:phytoene dehydrogenase-like protein